MQLKNSQMTKIRKYAQKEKKMKFNKIPFVHSFC